MSRKKSETRIRQSFEAVIVQSCADTNCVKWIRDLLHRRPEAECGQPAVFPFGASLRVSYCATLRPSTKYACNRVGSDSQKGFGLNETC